MSSALTTLSLHNSTLKSDTEKPPVQLPLTLVPDADGHDEVDEGDGVEGDVPPVHQGPQVDQDQDDAEQDD